ncbi:aldo/keto reductase [Flavitalea sp. BT771]|uniref:aldo/keto reductase n=1 Tax=Flavitalea sp. BT771 TaxID=3063329 RepID=UPI0026E3402E|nr:aldo/keto reductase [Flavitalea sp. BT771]MDO6435355.1 aldo/keto reductase [Flavitalea sp. BT771]MDV6224285.1 aldo/keto reductase [Flavitalea sp. BT771]
MIKRQLGRSGLQVAPLALGGNVFGWTIDEATSFQILDRFVDAGFNLVDTADIYSRWVPGNQGGESETIIGKWVKSRGLRDKVVIATKVGGDMGQGKRDISREYILSAVDNSLRRLQTDHIDLYQSHWDDDVTPVEETMEAYAELIKAGKVRAIGASNFTLTRLKASLEASARIGYPRYESVQPQYNLYDRQEFEQELEPLCKELQVGVISYFSLARGFLSGKYRSEGDLAKSVRGGGVKAYLNERGYRILAALDEVAVQYATNPASVALAWLIARPSITAPISSATSTAQLDDLVKAASLSLDATALEKLNKASAY